MSRAFYDIRRFLARFYWDEVGVTLISSIVVLLVSLFFANFESIYPLYDPLAPTVDNGQPGLMALFQLIQWPAIVSTAGALVTVSIKLAIKIRDRNKQRPSTSA